MLIPDTETTTAPDPFNDAKAIIPNCMFGIATFCRERWSKRLPQNRFRTRSRIAGHLIQIAGADIRDHCSLCDTIMDTP